MVATRRFSAICMAIFAVLPLQAGCSDDGVQPDRLLSVSLSPSDSTIFVGDAVVYEAVAEYESGTRQPDSVTWTVSDPEVLGLTAEVGGSARVVGLTRGEGYVLCEAEEDVADSAAVEVVQPGDVRWRQQIGDTWEIPTPALDGGGRVYFVEGANPDSRSLTVHDPDGTRVWSVPTCDWSDMSPVVSSSGEACVTGRNCTQRHGSSGAVEWTSPLGTPDGGVAVMPDGSVVFVFDDEGVNPQQFYVSLSRISAGGVEMWRDTLGLGSGIGAQKAAPAIGQDGEIYVAWQDENYSDWLSRVGPGGAVRWSVPLSGWSRRSTPALYMDRVAVSFYMGVAAYDKSGALLWEGDEVGALTSSPVADGTGNLYVQSQGVLASYDLTGAVRWLADSLSFARIGYGVPAPTLLQDNSLITACSREICSVDARDGSLNWRTSLALFFNSSATVAPDGTIYVTSDNEILALWGRTPPLAEGWPTEGGGMGRLRRQ